MGYGGVTMKMRWIISPLLLIMIFAASCGDLQQYLLYKPDHEAEKTQLQIRELQERNYDETNIKMVLKAILNVLQDDGYMIKNLNAELGYFNAVREKTRILSIAGKRIPLKDVIEATVNATTFGSKIRIRASFYYRCIQKPYNNVGTWVEESEWGSTAIHDPQFYQDFFSKVDKGIFIQKEKI
jgi:hypothetical protein